MNNNISIRSTAYPPGYINPEDLKPKQAVKAYNRHQRDLQRSLDKLYNTDKASKYII
jgi:hypothetical protein